jgi:sugar/nucleoside kinase (ribokinase family)
LVVITAGKEGQYIYDHPAKKKYHLPAYPVKKAVDTIGANDAFGGGFFAGYLLHFDPVQAALIGNVSASIKVEGSTPKHLLMTMPELAAARLEYMQGMIEVC